MAKKKQLEITDQQRCIDPLFGELSLIQHVMGQAMKRGVQLKVTQSGHGLTVLFVGCSLCPIHKCIYHGKQCPVCK
jgi:hypothetical protein